MKSYIKAEEKDLQVIYDIVQKSILTIYPRYYPAEVVKFFSELHCIENIKKDISAGLVGVLLVDGMPVGTGCYKDNHITRVYVAPEHQGMGYGSYIMDCLEQIIAEHYSSVDLDASLPANRLYEKRGYITIEHCRHQVEHDAFLAYEIMEKHLNNNVTKI